MARYLLLTSGVLALLFLAKTPPLSAQETAFPFSSPASSTPEASSPYRGFSGTSSSNTPSSDTSTGGIPDMGTPSTPSLFPPPEESPPSYPSRPGSAAGSRTPPPPSRSGRTDSLPPKTSEPPEPAAPATQTAPVSPTTPVNQPVRQPQQPATAAPTRAKQPQTLRSLEEPGHPFAGLLVLPRDRTTVIEGTPLFLADLLKNHRSPAVRRPLLHAYWKLAALLVECAFLAQRETEIQAWLAQFRASNTGNNYIKAQIDILEAASRRAAAERNIRELEFVQKQYELAQLLNPGFLVSSPQDTSKLPIPCDYPLVTAYLTRIDKMPGVTQRARLLDRLITMQYKKIPECLTAQAAASDYSLVLLNQETQSRM